MSDRGSIKREVLEFMGRGPLMVHDMARFVDGLVDLILDKAEDND